MPDSGSGSGDAILWIVVAIVVAIAAAAIAFFRYKGRRMPGAHVFRASRLSRGNVLFPTQVGVTPTSIIHYSPELVGGREQSMHLAHIASVMIESSGGASPVRCHGHRKADAVEMKRLIEQYQSEYYRGRADGRGTPEEVRQP